MHCRIWYHLYNLKNMKNTHGRVLLLVKLQAEAVNDFVLVFLLLTLSIFHTRFLLVLLLLTLNK